MPEPLERGRRRWGRLTAIVAGLILLCAALLRLPLADGDSAQDLVASLASSPGRIGALWWPAVAAVVAASALHYLLAALALKATAGLRLPIRVLEATGVSLVAAVANRMTPAGLGGAAINTRYLSRRGLSIAAAVGAVAALSMLGGIADMLSLVALLTAGAALGGASSWSAVIAVAGRLESSAGSVLRLPLPVLATAAVVAAVIAALVDQRRQLPSSRLAHALRHLPKALRRTLVQVRGLMRRPADLAVLLLSSAGTTVVLAVAMVCSLAAVRHGFSGLHVEDILVAHMIGSAVGSAIPVPAGIGSTEATLAAALVQVSVPLGQAVAAVLLFRLLTFWMPVPLGIVAGARLRRRQAL